MARREYGEHNEKSRLPTSYRPGKMATLMKKVHKATIDDGEDYQGESHTSKLGTAFMIIMDADAADYMNRASSKKIAVIIDLVECYAHRGDVLAGLCLYEYAMIIKIAVLTEGHNADCDSPLANGEKRATGAGRPPNARFHFGVGYRSRTKLTQQLRSKFVIPKL
jgi:hypothetical protein